MRSESKAKNRNAEDTASKHQRPNSQQPRSQPPQTNAHCIEQRKANAEEELAIVMAQNELADSGEEDKPEASSGTRSGDIQSGG